jgi:hypothetical protein
MAGDRRSLRRTQSIKMICRQSSQLEQLIRPRRSPPPQLDSASPLYNGVEGRSWSGILETRLDNVVCCGLKFSEDLGFFAFASNSTPASGLDLVLSYDFTVSATGVDPSSPTVLLSFGEMPAGTPSPSSALYTNIVWQGTGVYVGELSYHLPQIIVRPNEFDGVGAVISVTTALELDTPLGTTLTIDVPADSSFGFNAASGSVPEPASIRLALMMLALWLIGAVCRSVRDRSSVGLA